MKDWIEFAGSWKLFRGYWKIGLDGIPSFLFEKAFIKAAQHLIPELSADQVEEAPSGVRAQAIPKPVIWKRISDYSRNPELFML